MLTALISKSCKRLARLRAAPAEPWQGQAGRQETFLFFCSIPGRSRPNPSLGSADPALLLPSGELPARTGAGGSLSHCWALEGAALGSGQGVPPRAPVLKPPEPPRLGTPIPEGFAWTLQLCLVCSAQPWLSNTRNVPHLGTAGYIPRWFGFPSVGAWLELPPGQPSVTLAQSDPTGQQLRADPCPAGLGWSTPALGCPTPPWGHLELQTATNPDPTGAGWGETEPCQNPTISHMRGKETPQETNKAFAPFLLFS